MEKKVTQRDRVIRFMKDNGSITSLDAIREFGCTRLASAIFDIRNSGTPIYDVFETSKNRYGDYVTYKRYFLYKKELNRYLKEKNLLKDRDK